MSKNEELKGIRELREKLSKKNLNEIPLIEEYNKYDLTESDMISIEKLYYLKESKKLKEEEFIEKKNNILKSYILNLNKDFEELKIEEDPNKNMKKFKRLTLIKRIEKEDSINNIISKEEGTYHIINDNSVTNSNNKQKRKSLFSLSGSEKSLKEKNKILEKNSEIEKND
jgi:hypothetical protein